MWWLVIVVPFVIAILLSWVAIRGCLKAWKNPSKQQDNREASQLSQKHNNIEVESGDFNRPQRKPFVLSEADVKALSAKRGV